MLARIGKTISGMIRDRIGREDDRQHLADVFGALVGSTVEWMRTRAIGLRVEESPKTILKEISQR